MTSLTILILADMDYEDVREELKKHHGSVPGRRQVVLRDIVVAIYELCLIILQTLQYTMKNSLGCEDVERPLVAAQWMVWRGTLQAKTDSNGSFWRHCIRYSRRSDHFACKYDVSDDFDG